MSKQTFDVVSRRLAMASLGLFLAGGCRSKQPTDVPPEIEPAAAATEESGFYTVADPTGRLYLVTTEANALAAQRGEFTDATLVERDGQSIMVENGQPQLLQAYFGR